MKTNILFLMLFLFCIVSCTSDDEDVILPAPAKQVDFSDLQEEQKTTYIRYSTKCDSLETLFEYTGDTLELQVIKRGDSLFFQEMVSLGSSLYTSGAFVEPVTYPVTAFENRINIPERSASALFFFYENDDIYLQPQHDVDLEQDGCRLLQDSAPFIGNDIGYLDLFKIGDIEVTEKTSISCEPLEDLDAYLIYDKNQLIISHVITIEGLIGWTEERVFGWKLLD